MRERPDPEVHDWVDGLMRTELWICSVVVAEIAAGIELMPAGKRQELLRNALEKLIRVDFLNPLATRNIREFEHCGVKLIDPWGTP